MPNGSWFIQDEEAMDRVMWNPVALTLALSHWLFHRDPEIIPKQPGTLFLSFFIAQLSFRMVIHLVKVSPKNGKFFEQLDVLVCAKKNAEDDVTWFEP